jgi:TatD DNase family protein
MIDSHTHLHLDPAVAAEWVADARAVGVTRILTIGTDEETCAAALAASQAHEDVFCAVGLHPNYTTGYTGIEWLREYAAQPNVRAIGETGLDDFRDYAPRVDQEPAFADQIALARELGKPLVIHTRAADDDTIDTLAREASGLEVILHCFSMASRLEECLDHGWWISFAGNVTYPKAADLAEAAEKVPLERLLVETDAPYLTPQVVRKHRNRPAYVTHTAAFIAERRGIAYAELDAAVEANGAKLFGW